MTYFLREKLPVNLQHGLVSVMMPVFNGAQFLRAAIDSILAQTYRRLEIIVLDNQSTDETQAICIEYMRKDPRLLLVIDSERRNPHDAANRLAELVSGEYCFIACDDDVWAPDFVEKLLATHVKHPEISLAYPNARYIDIDGITGGGAILPRRARFDAGRSPTVNAAYYLHSRRVVPPIFGLFKTEAYFRALPFHTFDETIADVDNLLMLRILLAGPVHCLDEPLFYYRNKFRWADPEVLSTMRLHGSAIGRWRYATRHQWQVFRLVADDINRLATGFSRFCCLAAALTSFVYYSGLRQLRGALGSALVRARIRSGPRTEWDDSAGIRHDALTLPADEKK